MTSIHDWTPDSDPTIRAITAALIEAGVDPNAIDGHFDGVVLVESIAIGDQGTAEDGPSWWAAVDDEDRGIYEGPDLAALARAVAEHVTAGR